MAEYYASHALSKAKQVEAEQYRTIKERMMTDIKSCFDQGKTCVHHFVDSQYQYFFPYISDWLKDLGYTVTYEEEVCANLDPTGYHKFIIDWSEPTDEC